MASASGIRSGRLPEAQLVENFLDLHPPLSPFEARVAAERCLYCYDAPCITACPTSIDIPLFIRQIATGNPLGAAKTILSQNVLGAMCARVCPTETLCEGACVRNDSEAHPVEIGSLQRYATDVLLDKGAQPFRRAPATGKTIAVVGAGPAGLACAHRLAMLGHEVTLFEAKDKAGGLNEYGIAAYKATDGIAQREADMVLALGGITLKSGEKLGDTLSLTDLAASFDAVFLGVGLGGTNALGIPDAVEGVEDAVDYIARLRQSDDLATLPVGRKVVVIGGGMTAIDIASQIKRLGAEEVTIAYRRGQEDMKASAYEQHIAQTDGCTIRTWLKPSKILSENGKLTGIELEYTALNDGKLTGTGETVTLPCDQLFKAIGQTLLEEHLSGALTLKGGRIVTDGEGRTSLAKVWAGGDCVYGGEDLTVSAVRDGREAALSIHAALSGQARKTA